MATEADWDFPGLHLCSMICLHGVNRTKPRRSSKETAEKLERHVFNVRVETVALKKKAVLEKACERRNVLESAKKEIARLFRDAY